MKPEDIMNNANKILSQYVEQTDSYNKIALILKVVPLESFDEIFRFFNRPDQKKILESMETPTKISSIETTMVVMEFIRENDLLRYLKTTTDTYEEILAAFQKYVTKHPRKISKMLSKTWL